MLFFIFSGKVTPTRLIVLRGTPEDCDTVSSQAKKSHPHLEAFAPTNFQSVSFTVRSDRLRVLLPHHYLNPDKQQLITPGGEEKGDRESQTVCSVSLASGYLRRISAGMSSLSQSLSARVAEAKADGVQLLQLIEKPSSKPIEESKGLNETEDGEGNSTELLDTEDECPSLLAKDLPELNKVQTEGVKVGALSVGEVLLKTLQTELEKSGVSVEYKLIPGGAILLCAGQVIVRKENENDFIVEGPPCHAYFQTKNAIYRQFAFL
jgi:hypothetical protein